MDAVRGREHQFQAVLSIFDHFINLSRAEMDARVSILFGALVVTYIKIGDLKMRWLFFFMGRARFIDIGQFIK
jgi:hypothetical protein